jgi:hypothetical protein
MQKGLKHGKPDMKQVLDSILCPDFCRLLDFNKPLTKTLDRQDFSIGGGVKLSFERTDNTTTTTEEPDTKYDNETGKKNPKLTVDSVRVEKTLTIMSGGAYITLDEQQISDLKDILNDTKYIFTQDQ